MVTRTIVVAVGYRGRRATVMALADRGVEPFEGGSRLFSRSVSAIAAKNPNNSAASGVAD